MIIWYPANFMPVVKKQSHLCVTSIIITSGLFITMNNEHSLCLWQCSQSHKWILFKFWKTFVWSSWVWLRTSNAVVWTDNGSNPGSGRKYQNYFYPMVRRGEVSVFIVQPSPRCWACHVSRVRHVSGRTSQHWPASPPATFLPPGAAQVSRMTGAYQHQLALHPLTNNEKLHFKGVLLNRAGEIDPFSSSTNTYYIR